MRILSFILIVFFLLGLSAILYLKLVISQLSFSLSLNRIQIGEISLQSLKEDTSFVKLNINLDINNKSSLSISYSDLRVLISYNGNLVAETPKDYRAPKTTIPAKNKVYTIEPINLYINPKTIIMLGLIKSGQPIIFDYIVYYKIFGIELPPYRGSFEYKFSVYQS